MKSKIVVIISDLHCGHLVGLTPPAYQHKPVKKGAKHNKWVKIQRALWYEYMNIIRKIPTPDVLIVNGDCIDGSGQKSGGTELITTDRSQQVDMSVDCIKRWKAKKIIMGLGTPYHTGDTEDFENQIADEVGAEKIGAHEWVSVNGCVFDVKHFVGFSSIPHGQATPIMRDRLWNVLWSLRKDQPLGDVVVRSHVHTFCRIQTADYEAITTPALQGMGSKYGARICSRTVDFGVVWWEVRSKYDRDFHSEIVRIQEQKAKAIVI